MDMGQALRTAIGNLLANRVRCLQAMLAMVVGVAGVVVVLMGSGTLLNSNTRIYDLFAPASFNTFVEQNAEYPKAVTQADMEQVARDNPEVIKSISPLVYSMDTPIRVQISNGNKIFKSALYGVGESYLELYPEAYVQEGRFLQYMDISREQKVCVIGNNIAQELFDGDALGKTVRIWGENYTVVGILAALSFDFEVNDELLIPYSNARKIFGERIMSYNYYDDQYLIVANGVENVTEMQQLLKNMLIEKTGGETGSIYDPTTKWTLNFYGVSAIAETVKGSIYQYIYFGLLAAAVVLFIGGVGIMNVMLAAVQERTKEIGIRKAFGATVKDIKRQFFMESVIISLIGGLLGFVLGLAVIFLAAFGGIVVQVYSAPNHVLIADMDFLTFGIPILVVLAVCVGIGVVFGTYPAQQAAKMEIVNAINEN